MHRLIPPFVQAQYARGRRAGSFKACTIFVDISGFSLIADALMGHGQHGAEVLANIIRHIFDPLMQSVYEQDGFITNLAGDAFTAVFLMDGESTDAHERALAAAWQIQAHMAAGIEQQTPYGNFMITAKAGVAAGEVAWGILTGAENSRAMYYFRGPAIDECTMAEKQAKAGEIIATADVVRTLQTKLTAERRGDQFQVTGLKGVFPPPRPFHLPEVDPDIMTRFYPAEAARPELAGEFRQIASMFVSLPMVKTDEQLEPFVQAIFGLQNRYGGLLNRIDFGDKGASLLLFWGAPRAHENDLVRALNFVLDLQQQAILPFSAGVSYSIAHTGFSGGALAGEYTCHGRGITLAARIMQASPGGEIWVDENVAERAARQFEFDFVAEMALKGFAQPQLVFRLMGRQETTEPFFHGTMIGRQAERARLIEFVQPLWQGQPAGTMAILGEPGIGKSRLVHACLQHLASAVNDGFVLCLCQADEILRESLNPFRYWLRSYFGQSAQKSVSGNRRRFVRRLEQLIKATPDPELKAELERTRSFLGALVNLHWPGSLYEQLDAQGRYQNSLLGLLTLLKAESQQQPVILLVEDAQWLDNDSQNFLRLLVQELDLYPRFPLAILATARLENDRPLLGTEVPYQVISLDEMRPEDLALLAENQLGAPADPDLIRLLANRSEGNPFFGEQILRYLQEQGQLQLEQGTWHLKEAQGTSLPADVQAVLIARLDRLSHDIKDMVQTASVLGREFEIELLANMLSDDPEIRQKAVQAEQADIWSAINELRYLFKHALLRDAAYQMQVRSRRQKLHRLAATALENLHGDELSLRYGELAHHYEQAGLSQQARHYLEMAGEVSAAAYHNNLALDYYSRALELTPELERATRFRLLMARETVYDRLGARQEQRRDLRTLSDLAEAVADVARQIEVMIRQVWLLFWTTELPRALDVARRAAELAQASQEPGLESQAQYAIAWLLLQLGDLSTAQTSAHRALALARELGYRREEGNVHNVLGMIAIAKADYPVARRNLAEFLAISEENHDRNRQSTALGNLGVVSQLLGDYAAAKRYFERALALTRELGNRVLLGSDYINLSWTEATQGEWEQALQHSEAGLALKRQDGHTEGVAEGLVWHGDALFGMGEPEKAWAAYEASLRLRRELEQEHFAMEAMAGMARAALALNDLQAAAEYGRQILSFLENGGSLSRAWESLRIYFTCYQALRLAGDPRAAGVLETAYQRLQQQADGFADAGERRTFLENVPWNRAIIAAYHDRG